MSNQLDAQLRLPELQTPNSNVISDIERVRLVGESEDTEVEVVLTNVPIARPNKTTFFRTHPEPEYTFRCMLLELKETNETYIVTPQISELIKGLARPVCLYLAVDTNGVPRLISVPLPANGNSNQWHLSLQQCVLLARKKWIRMQADISAGAYVACASAMALEPTWPTETMLELVEIAARGNIITAADHPVIVHLRGEDV